MTPPLSIHPRVCVYPGMPSGSMVVVVVGHDLAAWSPPWQPPTADTASDLGATIGDVATTLAPDPAEADRLYQDRTRLAHAICLRDLHTYTLSLLGVLGRAAGPGAFSSCSRRLELLQKRVKILAILADRAHGASWEAIGEDWSLPGDTAEQIFGPMEESWRAGSRTPWAPRLDCPVRVPGMMPIDLTGMMPIDLTGESESGLSVYYAGAVAPGSTSSGGAN